MTLIPLIRSKTANKIELHLHYWPEGYFYLLFCPSDCKEYKNTFLKGLLGFLWYPKLFNPPSVVMWLPEQNL